MYSHTGHGAGKVGTYSNHPLHFLINGTAKAVLSTTGSLSTTPQGTLWGSSNDGSGSGLDADLLDGQQGSYYNQSQFTGSAFTSRNSGNAIAIDSVTTNMVGYVNSSTAAGYADGAGFSAAYNSLWVGQLFVDFRTGKLSTRGKNNGTWQAHRFMWDNLNDGSGSGLDADLLDGQQGSYYYPASNPNGYTNDQTAAEIQSLGMARFYNNAVLNSSTTTASLIAELIADYGCFNNNQVTLKVQWSYAGSSDLVTGDATIGTIELAGCLVEAWGGTYKHIRITRPTTGSGGQKICVYNDQGSGYSPQWREIWTSKSDGSGSGLDADTVDGVQASSFVQGVIGGYNRLSVSSTAVVVNEDSRDLDFRVESNSNINAIRVDGATGDVGIHRFGDFSGGASASATVSVNGAVARIGRTFSNFNDLWLNQDGGIHEGHSSFNPSNSPNSESWYHCKAMSISTGFNAMYATQVCTTITGRIYTRYNPSVTGSGSWTSWVEK